MKKTYLKKIDNYILFGIIQRIRYAQRSKLLLERIRRIPEDIFSNNLVNFESKGGLPIIEVITTHGMNDAVFRLKIKPLIDFLSNNFLFKKYDEKNVNVVAILIKGVNTVRLLKYKSPIEFKKFRPNALVIVFLADILDWEISEYKSLHDYVDLVIVPTVEIKNFIAPIMKCDIQVLADPVDYCLLGSIKEFPKIKSENKNRLVWFGYPQSYQKSMLPYENLLRKLVKEEVIEFHVLSSEMPKSILDFGIFHKYDSSSFLDVITNFDTCIVNHMPYDFSLETYFKSENKAVLSINRGLIVVASRTPSYEKLFKSLGIEDYLFSSISELDIILRELITKEKKKNYLLKCQDYIDDVYSPVKYSNKWLSIYENYRFNISRLRSDNLL
jgi:hypothetical protein